MPLAPTDRTLNVLTITPFFPSRENEVGGCFVAETIPELARLGIVSSVIAVSPLHHPGRRASASAPAEWLRYPAVPGNLGLASAGKSLFARLYARVRRLHREKPIDLIHAHAALPCGHAAAILSRRLKIPFVVSVHGLDAFNTCYAEGMAADWRRSVSREVYSAARNVICVSGRVQQIVQSGTPLQTHSTIVYNGVDPDLFCPSAEVETESNPEILIVGNLLRSKGHALVLRALARLQDSWPEVRCRIIGEGPERSPLESLARELAIGERVLFAGRRSRSQVADAMRRCSVFALPSSNEGLGCVYLEAMSCGKPAIGCSGQGIDEIIEHGKNGWLIPAGGLDELVQGLNLLLKPSIRRASIAAAARQTVLDRLTLSHQARKLVEVYRRVIISLTTESREQKLGFK